MVAKPLVTIVTVVWNDRTGLESTIQSIQPVKDESVEYIVIDGGSTDGTLEVIAKYESSIDHWISEPDEGIYDAMNKGADLATGEWIWFMNAGDLVHDEGVLKRIDSLLRGDYDIILGGTKTILRDEYQVRKGYRPPSGVDQIWKEMPACHQSTLIRTRLQKSYRFDTSYKWCADFDLVQRLFQAKKRFVTIDSPLCVYDCVPGETRHWSIYIRERWRASLGSVSAFQRCKYFGWEYLVNLFVRPLGALWRLLAPAGVVLMVRRIRGTA